MLFFQKGKRKREKKKSRVQKTFVLKQHNKEADVVDMLSLMVMIEMTMRKCSEEEERKGLAFLSLNLGFCIHPK